MATFDAKEYKAVLKAYSKGEDAEQLREVLTAMTRDPQSEAYARLDLNAALAVPTPVTTADLRDWRTGIASALNKAQGLPAGKMFKQLLDALARQGANLEDPSFWGELQSKRQTYIQSALDDKMKMLRAEYPLGVATEDELVTGLAAVGITGVTVGSIRKVARDNDLEIVGSFDLPAAGSAAAIERPWRAVAQYPEYRSILDVLLLHRPDDIDAVTVIDRLGSPGGPITVSDIDAARAKSEQGRDSNALQAAQKLLVALKSECRDDAALARVVLATVVEAVQRQLGRGKPKLSVRDDLVDTGVDARDAARLVSAIVARPGAEASGGTLGLELVRQALSDGDLAQAERTLAAVTPDDDEVEECASLGRDIEVLKKRKRVALDVYRARTAVKDYAAALEAITEAMGIDQGDEALPVLRAALPPAAPRSFAVRVNDRGASMSWANAADEAITYTVVRAVGHVPASPTDGDVVASGFGASSAIDEAPPVGVEVSYAVFAVRDGSLPSDPASVTMLVLMPPRNVRFSADPTAAEITWELSRPAVAAVVTRQDPDGSVSEVDVTQGATMRASGLITGARYRFAVRAAYSVEGGRRLSEPVAVSVTPRGAARTVGDLEVAGDGDGLHATWSEIEGFEVELWSFPPNASLPEGRQADRATLQTLEGAPTMMRPGTTSSSADLSPFEGFARIVPLTVVDDGFLVGYSVIAGTARPATEITAEAFGSDLRISWRWPSDDCLMELAWRVDGATRTRRVTPARYRADGGVTIAGGADATELSLATVVRFDGDESILARTPVPWQPRAAARSAVYALKLRRSLLGQVTCDVVATSVDTGFVIPARVVLTRGSAMPWDKDDGRAVAEIDFDFTAHTTSRHEIVIGKERSPFWVAVFPLDDAELTPPSTRDLKG